MDRIETLRRWVASEFPGRSPTLAPASSDASFRRYFRLVFADGAPSRIVMDAPPGQEDCAPFVHVAGLLRAAGVNAPEVLAQDLDQGFLLLSDLGSRTYLDALRDLRELHADPAGADRLYRDATACLLRIQCGAPAQSLPAYDRTLLLRELRLLPDWYIARHHGAVLSAAQQADLQAAFEALVANNLAQGTVFVHRDFHSRNLMLCEPADQRGANPGVLDFQDAVRGPVTYDLVSLLRDAYIEWEEARVLDWCIRYWEGARAAGLPVNADFGEFYRDFEWMGLQRHLKVLGIFARLSHRDGKDAYLADLPLVLRYARRTCERYRVFAPLLRILDEVTGVETRTGITF